VTHRRAKLLNSQTATDEARSFAPAESETVRAKLRQALPDDGVRETTTGGCGATSDHDAACTRQVLPWVSVAITLTYFVIRSHGAEAGR